MPKIKYQNDLHTNFDSQNCYKYYQYVCAVTSKIIHLCSQMYTTMQTMSTDEVRLRKILLPLRVRWWTQPRQCHLCHDSRISYSAESRGHKTGRPIFVDDRPCT